MRKNIPAIVSAGTAVGLTDAIIMISFNIFFAFITERRLNGVVG
jgi:hypothetical protein